jgi:hypothetical protein
MVYIFWAVGVGVKNPLYNVEFCNSIIFDHSRSELILFAVIAKIISALFNQKGRIYMQRLRYYLTPFAHSRYSYVISIAISNRANANKT